MGEKGEAYTRHIFRCFAAQHVCNSGVFGLDTASQEIAQVHMPSRIVYLNCLTDCAIKVLSAAKMDVPSELLVERIYTSVSYTHLTLPTILLV